MKRDHVITTAGDRCGTCRQPVGYTVVRVPCQCVQEPAGWPCHHTVSFLRHYPERK